MASYDRAIQLKPDFGDAYSKLGDIYLKQGLSKKGLRMKRFGSHGISFDTSSGIKVLGRKKMKRIKVSILSAAPNFIGGWKVEPLDLCDDLVDFLIPIRRSKQKELRLEALIQI